MSYKANRNQCDAPGTTLALLSGVANPTHHTEFKAEPHPLIALLPLFLILAFAILATFS